MRKSVLVALGAATIVALPAAGAASAQANQQELNFTVTAAQNGGLSVNTGGPVSTLGLASNGGSASGSLTVFSITDTRGTTNGWNAYLALSDFVHTQDATAVIPATKATYHPPSSALGLVFGGTANRAAADIPLKNDDTLIMTRTQRTLAAPLETATIPNLNAMTVDLSGTVAIGQYKATLTLSAL
ncbi:MULTISPECIES: hypothetical protein [unclassified Dietzia]|uniref:hypothetical protein n=1 Tax=unclassified Dietzia TaxID=2617939 RepID=UPI0012E7BFE4|nr:MULTISPECIES: hypothetical protein [unclassified Dietzia]QGW25695.1 hypothetical protein GJR88_04099 [Dietzia sp. DQ12-45-1b]